MVEKLGILLYENAQPMDIIGPWEVFSFWKNILDAPINLSLISENGSCVECSNDIVLKAHVDFEHCPQLDYLIVPGGSGRLKEVNNEKLIRFIQKQAQHCKYVLSDCTGMFLLNKAGLLKNKSVTTYWRALPELKSFADLHIVPERIVKSGNIWTAGGVSSGIDLALELINEVAGKETAGKVQLLFEYFPPKKIYGSLNSVNTLPPYNGHKATEEELPKYIKDWFGE